MAKAGFAGRLTALLHRFRNDSRGNVAVIFTMALLPILAAIGCAVDYSQASRMKAKMVSAADAASVASISQNSAGFIAASKMSSDGSVAAGVTDANNIFNGNLNATSGYTNLALTSTVQKTGPTLNSVVTFSASVPVTFMSVLGYKTLTVTGTSKASSALPLYLDFYLTLDVSGSMGLPSTPAEAVRMQAINPDNWVQYRTGCTLACHFAPQKSACIDPPVTPPTNPATNPATNSSYSQQYNTNNYCMGYAYSRVSQTGLTNLVKMASTGSVPKQVPGLPDSMISGLPSSLNSDPKWGLPAATSCPTDGTDACIQLRLDAVGVAVNALFKKASDPAVEKVTNQFRIGLYPFITTLNANYFKLTASITGSPTTPGTINYAAANLAQLLDTNMDSNLGSGGTHIDVALNSMNTVITSVGDGSTANKTLPYVFLITDGAQDPQSKGVPNGGWSGSNHATVLNDFNNAYPNACATLKQRGITIAVLYIPYQTISPVNTSFAGDEDDAANNNIPNIPASLQACASSGFYWSAATPQGISDALGKMFDKALAVAHITN
jgi:Flp pilus assembly protein TadG